MNEGDMYGTPASPWGQPAYALNGPNQGYVASPVAGTTAGIAPAISLVGLAILLVAYRVVVEMYGED